MYGEAISTMSSFLKNNGTTNPADMAKGATLSSYQRPQIIEDSEKMLITAGR